MTMVYFYDAKYKSQKIMAQIGKEMQNMSYVSPSKYKDLNICSLQFFKEVFFSGLRLYSIKIGRFGGA